MADNNTTPTWVLQVPNGLSNYTYTTTNETLWHEYQAKGFYGLDRAFRDTLRNDCPKPSSGSKEVISSVSLVLFVIIMGLGLLYAIVTVCHDKFVKNRVSEAAIAPEEDLEHNATPDAAQAQSRLERARQGWNARGGDAAAPKQPVRKDATSRDAGVTIPPSYREGQQGTGAGQVAYELEWFRWDEPDPTQPPPAYRP